MKTRIPILIMLAVLITFISIMSGVVIPARAATDLPVYTDSLAAGWEDWPYNSATLNYVNASPTHSGTASIAVTYTEGWDGLQIGYHGTNLDVSAYDTFRFWIHGGSTGGQNILLQIGDLEQTLTPQANTWTKVDVSLLSLGSPRTVYSITWFNNTAGSQGKFYLDDLAFVDSGATPPPTLHPGAGPALSINATSGQHPISPYIYGMNYASETIAADLDLPVRRWGGNSTSRYNWQNGFTNTGSDWYYENIPGNSADDFVNQDRRTGTKTILTMPLIGWVSKNSPSNHPFACGFKISKYGSQEDADWSWDADCGNGNHTSGAPITGNDPLDTSVAITASYATAWVNHLTSTFGTAGNGGVQFYNLDNEPMLWNSTHRDVHPNPTTYDELRDKTWAYAAAIKAADPTAKTLGPVVWGWCAYFYSAADGCSPGADHQAHGNTDFVEWYLQQMQAYEQQHGVRLLDYVDVHIYPQIDGLYSESLGSAEVQAARLRSTRQLWDTTYLHEGWIGQPVYLIPRMKQWVANNYPGTKLAITEYNWGAHGYMNGALAQADLLGIFGREGLDLATLWGPPENANAPAIFAFRMFRNYDGTGSKFGDISLTANSADQSRLAIYAARRAQDGALTLMAINKTGQALTSSLTLAGFAPASNAAVYRYSATNLAAIIHESDQAVTSSGFSATFPANSITLVVIPAATTQLTFAVIGDYGIDTTSELEVANMVKSWDPELVITTGDDYYSPAGGLGSEKYDESTGAYYCEYLKDIVTSGVRCPTGPATINKFFPSLGNHDYTDAGTINNLPATYTNYFTLPGDGYTNSSGNERYYDFVTGPVHFFVINSNSIEPDGVESNSVQAQWLQSQLAASTSVWNVAYFHHPPYSSGSSHGSSNWMQWPFAEWGADAILSGHDHIFERILLNGIVYMVNGTGGADLYSFGSPVNGSVFRYSANHGAQKVIATNTSIIFEFYSIDNGGTLRDTYTLLNENLLTISGNTGVSEATVGYDNGGPKTTTSGVNGSYSFTVPVGWTGTLTPSKTGYTFTPPSITISTPVTADLPGQNFTAAITQDNVATYRRVTGGAYWLNYNFATASFTNYLSFGDGGTSATCYPIAMDFDGDGIDEPTHLCGGGWHFFETNGAFVKSIFAYMQPGDIPVPGDYNGDGKDEVAVYRRTTGGAYWLFYDFATASFTNYVSHGDGGSSATCYPAAMDFDGDGSDELTHLCGGGWHFFETNGSFVKSIFAYMQPGDLPVPGDYNGDGTDEVAVYRRTTGGAYWLNYNFATASFTDYLSLGDGGATAACYPAAMDFDADGIAERTHLCGGGWHFFETNGAFVKSIFAYMQVGDKPVPGKYGD